MTPRCPEVDALIAFVRGRLTPPERTELEEHVDTCAPCRSALSEVAKGRAREARGRLGRYELVALLGSGGMGHVYRGRDPELDRDIAIKLVRASSGPSADELGRVLVAEAQTLARLSHANVCQVHDIGRDGDEVFIAMEYIAGSNLRVHLATARLAPAAIVALFGAAGRGLAAAHAIGIVHRDFKPDNVLVARDGRVVVADFGLARLAPAAGTAPASGSTACGTPGYIAPELLEGRAADARSDQFAFCVALVEALCGERPAADATVAPRGVPRRIARAIERGLASDPARRFSTIDSLLRVLEPRRRRRWVVAASGAGVVLGLALASVVRPGSSTGAPCDGVSAEATALWGPLQRVQFAQRLLATGRPFAEDQVARATQALDSTVAAWASARSATCSAYSGAQPAAYDPAWDCVERQRQEIAAVVDQLDHAAPTVLVERAGALARSITPLAACRSASPQIRSGGIVADALRTAALDHLVRAKVTMSLGDLGETQRELRTALAIAGTSDLGGMAAVHAEALYYVGSLEIDTHPARAVAALRDAISWAARAGDDWKMASATGQMLVVEGVRQGATADSLRQWPLVEALVTRAGSPPDLAGHVRMLHAELLATAGRLPEARDQYREAVELFERVHGPNSPEVARAEVQLATSEVRLGHFDVACAAAERAVVALRQALGDRDEGVASALYNLGSIELMSHRLDSARIHLEQARGLEQLHGNTSKLLGIVGNLGEVEHQAGHLDRALALDQQVLALDERLLPADHPDVAGSLANVAMVLVDMERPAEARPYLERAAAIMERAVPPENPDRVQIEAALRQIRSSR